MRSASISRSALAAAKRCWQTKAPPTGAMASSERTPMVW